MSSLHLEMWTECNLESRLLIFHGTAADEKHKTRFTQKATKQKCAGEMIFLRDARHKKGHCTCKHVSISA